MPKQFKFCKVCRRNHDQGRQHVYNKGHKDRLAALLSKALSKTKEARFFLKVPKVLRDQERDQNKYWCYFCEESIAETNSQYACSQTFEHLASGDHQAHVRLFFEENGAERAREAAYLLSQQELSKWREACTRLQTKDCASASPATQTADTTPERTNAVAFEGYNTPASPGALTACAPATTPSGNAGSSGSFASSCNVAAAVYSGRFPMHGDAVTGSTATNAANIQPSLLPFSACNAARFGPVSFSGSIGPNGVPQGNRPGVDPAILGQFGSPGSPGWAGYPVTLSQVVFPGATSQRAAHATPGQDFYPGTVRIAPAPFTSAAPSGGTSFAPTVLAGNAAPIPADLSGNSSAHAPGTAGPGFVHAAALPLCDPQVLPLHTPPVYPSPATTPQTIPAALPAGGGLPSLAPGPGGVPAQGLAMSAAPGPGAASSPRPVHRAMLAGASSAALAPSWDRVGIAGRVGLVGAGSGPLGGSFSVSSEDAADTHGGAAPAPQCQMGPADLTPWQLEESEPAETQASKGPERILSDTTESKGQPKGGRERGRRRQTPGAPVVVAAAAGGGGGCGGEGGQDNISSQTQRTSASPAVPSGEGNVHTGAPPPWLSPDEVAPAPVPLPELKTRLPPNRVGAAWSNRRRAELARAAEGGAAPSDVDHATWLPSFGRVWQMGSRRDTLKEFEAEQRAARKRAAREQSMAGATAESGQGHMGPKLATETVEARMTTEGTIEPSHSQRGAGGQDDEGGYVRVTSEASKAQFFPLRPYVSKRQRGLQEASARTDSLQESSATRHEG